MLMSLAGAVACLISGFSFHFDSAICTGILIEKRRSAVLSVVASSHVSTVIAYAPHLRVSRWAFAYSCSETATGIHYSTAMHAAHGPPVSVLSSCRCSRNRQRFSKKILRRTDGYVDTVRCFLLVGSVES